MNNLRWMRTDRKLTQRKLTELTGIDPATISKLETGTMPMTMKTAEVFAKALKCKAEDIVGEDSLRVIVVAADGNTSRPFPELLEAFLRGYDKNYRKAALCHETGTTFKDSNDCWTYQSVKDYLELAEKDRRKVDRLIGDLSIAKHGKK